MTHAMTFPASCTRRRAPAARGARRQRGQSMSEFLVSLIALVPIFLAITYLGRYADLHQRATQASRYAAFQRTMQPNTAILSDADLQDQMRARFFLAPKALNDGRIQSDDSVAAIGDAKKSPAIWSDLSGKALLAKPGDVMLTWGSTPMGSTGTVALLDKAFELVGKDYGTGHRAMVEMSLVNRLNQAEASPAVLKLAAATAAPGTALTANGGSATADAARNLVFSSWIPSIVTDVLSFVVGLFEPEAPHIGCIKADTVPTNRLEGAAQSDFCR
jgi:hypothetical protein